MNNFHETGYHLTNNSAQHQYGPDITFNFVGLNKPFDYVKAIATRLLDDDDDLTLTRLLTIIKSISIN